MGSTSIRVLRKQHSALATWFRRRGTHGSGRRKRRRADTRLCGCRAPVYQTGVPCGAAQRTPPRATELPTNRRHVPDDSPLVTAFSLSKALVSLLWNSTRLGLAPMIAESIDELALFPRPQQS